jgi:hypothetical protein
MGKDIRLDGAGEGEQGVEYDIVTDGRARQDRTGQGVPRQMRCEGGAAQHEARVGEVLCAQLHNTVRHNTATLYLYTTKLHCTALLSLQCTEPYLYVSFEVKKSLQALR